MDLDKYLSPVFGSQEWYRVIKDTYHFSNPYEEKKLYGVLTSLKQSYSLLPFSDWYYEVDNFSELEIINNQLHEFFPTGKFSARILIKQETVGKDMVATYRMNQLNEEDRFRSMSKTTRRYTKQSLQNKLSLEITDASGIDRFFTLHALTRKKLGLPVQPRQFFHYIMNGLTNSMLAFCVTENRKDAAAFFLIKDATQLYYKFGASNPTYLDKRPNHFLFYKLHEIAENENLNTIDLGRTDEPGLHQFKSGLGATPLLITNLSSKGFVTNHDSVKGLSKGRKILSHLPVLFHITAGKLFYRYFA